MSSIVGTLGNDLLTGTLSNDTIQGLNGNDTLISGLGYDSVDGGFGIDILQVNYSGLTTSITQSSWVGLSSISTINNWVYYSNIERFNLTGGSGNDSLFGGVLNDTLIGNAGNDTLDGGGGVDIVDGGAGIDTLVDADLSLLTTNLNLNMSGATLADILLSDGTSLKNFEFFTNVIGGAGNDVIRITSATAVNNAIEGGAGNDTLNAGLGYDTVNGGGGVDVLEVNYSTLTTSITQYLSSYSWDGLFSISTDNNSVYYGNIERFSLTGGSGNDNLFGSVLNDTLIGNAGNDTLNGGGGVDILDGGAGIDTLVYADLSLLTTNLNLNINGTTTLADILLSDGTSLKNFEFFTNVIGGSGNDVIRITSATAATNSIEGGAGNDTLNGGLGNDTVNGGGGVDVLEVNYSSLTTNISQYSLSYSLYGSSSISSSNNWVYYSNIERFNLTGGSGNDSLFGGAGNDTLIGNAGNDTLNGGGGVDILDGGAGIDTLVYADLSLLTTNLNLNINGTTTLADILLSDGTSLKNFELFTNIIGGAGNDVIRITSATAVNNAIQGGAGNDTLNGGLGNDTVNGGGGVDVLEVNYSSLTTDITQYSWVGSSSISSSFNSVYYSNIERFNLTGGSGNDSLVGKDLNDTLIGNAGNDTLDGRGGNDSIDAGSNNDSLIGGNGNDTLISGLGTDTVDGGGDFDVLVVNYATATTAVTQTSSSIAVSATADKVTFSNIEQFNLTGGSGNDSLFGAALADTLVGGAGNDTLKGNAGNDTLTGGNGADQFIFNNRNEGIDTITDFVKTQLDKIAVSKSGFAGGLTVGTLSLAQFRSGAGVTTAANTSQRFIYNTTSGALFFDADGTGTSSTATQIAILTGLPSLSNTDISVI